MSGPSLARDSGRTIVGAVVSNVCNVLVVLVVARLLGVAAVGEYTLAFAVRAILLLVCGLGMRTSMTRFVAAHLARSDPGGARGAVVLGVMGPVLVASVVGAVWFALAGVLASGAFSDSARVVPMRVFAVSLPFFVLLDTALAATQGFSDMRAYTWIGQVLEPGLRLVLTASLLVGGGGIVAASWALLVATVVSSVLALVVLVRMLGRLPAAPRTYPARALASYGMTSWVASMATQGLLWADVVILGVLVTSAEVGAYQVAARVVLIGMFVITALTAAAAPRWASSWERGDVARTTSRYVGVVLWSSRLTWPILAGLVAVPTAVLHLFGSDFGSASWVVVLLACGAAAEVLGAPSSVLLNQVGRNRLNMVVNLGTLAVNIGLNLALVPVWGIEGSAFAWALTLVLGAGVRVVVARRVALTRWPWSRELVGSSAGAGLALGAAVAATFALPSVVGLRLLVAGVVVLVVYLSVVVLVGLTATERDVVSREVTLRLPWVRRWRVQRGVRRVASARTGPGVLSIDELISPFRADVLARVELFRLAREQRDLLRRDEAAFLELARAGRYGMWFDEVLVARGHVPASDRTFRSIVRASLQLLERSERLGRSSLGRITVARVRAGASVGGWTLAEDRWVLLDGGHRVALALLEGVAVLSPSDYVVVDGATPPNNTALLVGSGRLAEAEWVGFLARGLVGVDARDGVRTWEDLLGALEVAGNREHLERWGVRSLVETG